MPMITHEQIHELAQFEDEGACALSFYFQPTAPRNKAHKEDAILARDLAREALRKLEHQTNSKAHDESARADLDRMIRLSNEWTSNGVHAKAVFACAAQGFWQEYDLPPQLTSTQLLADRHFHLKPLARLLEAFPRLGVVLVDRHRARVFDLQLGELTEREGLFHPLTRRGRGDGFAGYDGGHAERRVADEAREHLKSVAGFLKDALSKDTSKSTNNIFDKWILGCHNTLWPQFEPQLHAEVSQKLLGRFSADVAHISNEEIRTQAERIFSEAQELRCREAVREALTQARGNARGVTGLRRVLRSLELGEVQTLLLGDNYLAQAVECAGCGHLDAHLVNHCPACGRETRKVSDVAEAILPWVIRHDIELVYVKDDAEFDQVGNIAAILRFRADPHAREWPVTATLISRPAGRRTGLMSRYRDLASG